MAYKNETSVPFSQLPTTRKQTVIKEREDANAGLPQTVDDLRQRIILKFTALEGFRMMDTETNSVIGSISYEYNGQDTVSLKGINIETAYQDHGFSSLLLYLFTNEGSFNKIQKIAGTGTPNQLIITLADNQTSQIIAHITNKYKKKGTTTIETPADTNGDNGSELGDGATAQAKIEHNLLDLDGDAIYTSIVDKIHQAPTNFRNAKFTI